MSLHYIVDAYNVVRHASFIAHGHATAPEALARCIRDNRLCGSMKNKVTLVFDGYPEQGQFLKQMLDCELVYSQRLSADDYIIEQAQQSSNPRVIVVVTDDRTVQFHVKAAGATVLGVQEFLSRRAARYSGRGSQKDDLPKLSAADAERITKELKKLWLNEK